MARPVASVRAVAILMGVIVGSVLAYAYQVNLPTLTVASNEMNVTSLVVFVSIPLLAGFLVGLLDPATGVRDALIVGLVVGLVNSVMAAVKLIFTGSLATGEVLAFSLFAILSVFVWTVLAGAGAWLATKAYE